MRRQLIKVHCVGTLSSTTSFHILKSQTKVNMLCAGGSFDDPLRDSTSKWLAVSGFITIILFLVRLIAIAASPETQELSSDEDRAFQRSLRFIIVAGTGISLVGFFIAFVVSFHERFDFRKVYLLCSCMAAAERSKAILIICLFT